MMNILVTGASGFIGRAFMRRFAGLADAKNQVEQLVASRDETPRSRI